MFRVKVCPSQAAWSGTLLSIGEWTDVTKYLKSDLSSVLEGVHVYIKIESHAWLGQVMWSTLQMFTMLHVCKILFICHHWPVLMYSLLWSSHFFYMYLFSLFLLMIFHLLKITHLQLWLDLTLPTVWMSDEKLIHFNWTWHTNMNMKKKYIQETATILKM